jgi:hypothetical protein
MITLPLEIPLPHAVLFPPEFDIKISAIDINSLQAHNIYPPSVKPG